MVEVYFWKIFYSVQFHAVQIKYMKRATDSSSKQPAIAGGHFQTVRSLFKLLERTVCPIVPFLVPHFSSHFTLYGTVVCSLKISSNQPKITAKMPVITDNRTQPMLAPNGNRVRVVGERRRTEELAEKPSGIRWKASADSSSDSSSSSFSYGGLALRNSAKRGSSKRATVKNGNGFNKPAKIVPDGIQNMAPAPQVCVSVKRCDWITPNSGKFLVLPFDLQFNFSFPSVFFQNIYIYSETRKTGLCDIFLLSWCYGDDDHGI